MTSLLLLLLNAEEETLLLLLVLALSGFLLPCPSVLRTIAITLGGCELR